jgi:hypothetical protein
MIDDYFRGRLPESIHESRFADRLQKSDHLPRDCETKSAILEACQRLYFFAVGRILYSAKILGGVPPEMPSRGLGRVPFSESNLVTRAILNGEKASAGLNTDRLRQIFFDLEVMS